MQSKYFFNQPEGITFEKELYLIVFCIIWLGLINTEAEIEIAQERLIISMENTKTRQFLTDIVYADSLNDLLRRVGDKKDEILKLIF